MTEAKDIDRAVEGRTFTGMFRDTVATRGALPAIRWRADGGFREWSWDEYADRARRFAGALTGLSLRRGERVLLMMGNRPEFHVADTGTLLAGGTPVSIYNSSAAEQLVYLANNAEATVAVVGDPEYLDRFLAVRHRLTSLRHLVVIDGSIDGAPPSGVHRFTDLLDADPVDLDAAVAATSPDDLLTVIYTSGTTGAPKGVMHTHRTFAWALEATTRAMGTTMTGWELISYLPMAHVAERLFTHYFHVAHGSTATPCGDISQLAAYLLEVRPHCLGSVPRIWEKLHAGLQGAIAAAPDQAAIADALALGVRVGTARAAGSPLPAALQDEWTRAEAELLAPIKGRLGLDRCVMALTGGAPTPRHVFEFFLGLGIPISEVYGMSESPTATGWSLTEVKPGTVGRPQPGIEARLLDDGELLLRGGQVTTGYLNDPERTAEALDAQGWLHTGDIAEVDDEGYYRIVDRKKELIITSGGQNVAPAVVEGLLKRIPLVGQVCVVGDGHPYLVALLVLDPEASAAWAAEHGVPVESLPGAPGVRTELERAVAEVNAALSRPEQVKRFTALDDQWAPDSAELTPTAKLKRRNILARYAAEVEALYS